MDVRELWQKKKGRGAMAMKFKRTGPIGGLSALLLAAVGCGTEMSSGEQPEQVGSTTEAFTCNTAYYQPICLSYCQGTCTDGSQIAACMSVCMGGYCNPYH